MNWIQQIDEITDDFIFFFRDLDSEELNWKENSKTWSIAQNIEHLIVINKTYFPILEDIKAGKYKVSFLGSIHFIVSFFGKMILNSVNPNTKSKIKTFSIWEPSIEKISIDILNRFQEHQIELKKQIHEVEYFIKKGTVIASPVNKYIVYKLETAFDIIITHEKRHLKQAKEILVLLPSFKKK
ncbi:MAG: DinB family protein [Chitinophagaceae bacterium]|nr:DinB family protein [Chitinophagaceae bacterium]